MKLLTLLAMFLLDGDLELAKNNTLEKKYEESLQILSKIKPSPAQYNQYAYLMMINYVAINDEMNAKKWINNLKGSFVPLERRHEVMLAILEEEIKNWKDGDLSDIDRLMKRSADRLNINKVDEKTQSVQDEIIRKLDRLIDENTPKPNSNSAGSSQDKNTKPQQDSIIGEDAGKGQIDNKKIQEIAGKWGALPEKERELVKQQFTRDIPVKYKEMVESYFKDISRVIPEKR